MSSIWTVREHFWREKTKKHMRGFQWLCAVHTDAKFIVPDWGYKVDSGIGLSYQSGRLPRPAGRSDDPKKLPYSTTVDPPFRDYEFAYSMQLPQKSRLYPICFLMYISEACWALLRFWIRMRIRIRMLLCLPDAHPDPLVTNKIGDRINC